MASPEDTYTEKELELLTLRRNATRSSQQRSADDFMPTTGVGVPGGSETPNPPAPNMDRMVQDVSDAQAKLKEAAPSALPPIGDLAAGAGGLAVLGWLANKFMGGSSPDDNKRSSVRDRSIRREPQMDVTVKGPQEPVFAPEPVVQQAPAAPKTAAPIPELPQATIAGQQQPQMQYGQTTINAPTGAPNVAVAPPAEVAPAPVQPKPVDPLVQAKIDALAADQKRKDEAHAAEQRRRDEAHAARLTSEVKRTEEKAQKATASGGVPPETRQMLKSSEAAKVDKAVDANAKAVAKAVTPPVAPAVQAAPAATPVVEVPATTPKTSTSKEISLPKEWPAKGMNWITSQYGEEGARQFINQYNDGKPFKTHAEMKEVYDRVMTKPSYSTIPKTLRQERGITASPERQQYKIVPGGVVPPVLPSGGGGGGFVVLPRGGTPNEVIHSLNPLKL